jgi:hypothetical protein
MDELSRLPESLCKLALDRLHLLGISLCALTLDDLIWRPLIMSFCRFYGLGQELVESRLARIPEGQYRSPDVDRARLEPVKGTEGEAAA